MACALSLSGSCSCSWASSSFSNAAPRRSDRIRRVSARASKSDEDDAEEVVSVLGEAGLNPPEAAVGAALVDSGSRISLPDAEGSAISEELERIYSQCKIWQWRGAYKINYVALADSAGPPLLLIHGFGASIGHWRRNISVLAKDYSVYAIDLLGLGGSEKPAGFPYTIESWAELVLDFIREIMSGEPTVLVGNSIGSLVCLAAAGDAPQGLIRGLVLLNCAGGMNNKAVVDDWRIKLVFPLLRLIDWLLNQPAIATRLFNRVRTKENLKSVLSSVYCNKDAVDDELVEIIQKPAQDPGALEAFVSIITGPPGPTPMTLMPRIACPLLVLWGDTDPFTPIDGPVGKFFTALPASLPNVQLKRLENVGHCPHDDQPELVHDQILPWLANLSQNSN